MKTIRFLEYLIDNQGYCETSKLITFGLTNCDDCPLSIHNCTTSEAFEKAFELLSEFKTLELLKTM